MTVDSAYYPVVFANDGEVEYTVELESIGGVFQVYKVPDDGTARTLLTEDYHYTVAYEEHLDPIKKRAVITLAAPIASDAHLEVFRSTTIATDFAAEALKPFPSEQFEYTLDQICFIQQEIEGHLCDCRGDTFPPVVVPPVPNECQPFSCSAFEDFLEAQGVTLNPRLYTTAETFEWPFAPTTSKATWDGVRLSAWVNIVAGAGMMTDFGNPSSGFVSKADLTNWGIDPVIITDCDGEILQAVNVLGNNTFPCGIYPYQPTGPSTPDNFWGDHEFSGIMSGYNGTGEIQCQLRNAGKRYRVGSGAFWTLLTYVDVKATAGVLSVRVRVGGAVSGDGPGFSDSGWVEVGNVAYGWFPFVCRSVSSDLEDLTGAGSTRDYRAYITTTIKIAGVTVSATGYQDRTATVIPPTPNTLQSLGMPIMFYSISDDDRVSLMALNSRPYTGELEYSIDDLYTAYARNFEDYVRPGSCPTTNTETETVSSTPPVQGIFD